MKKQKIFFIILIYLNLLCLILNAEVFNEDLSQIAVSARMLGLGSSFIGMADDSFAVYANPAGLTQLNDQQISLMYYYPFTQIDDYYIGSVTYAVPIRASSDLPLEAVGVGFVSCMNGSIFSADESGPAAEPMDEYLAYGVVSLAYGVEFFRSEMSFGLSFKEIYKQIGDFSDGVLNMDVGVFYNVPTCPHCLRVGFVFQNILPASIKLNNTSEEIPFMINTGISYNIISGMMISLNIMDMISENLRFQLGTEYASIPSFTSFISHFALRAGYDIDAGIFTTGAGIIKNSFNMDYAFGFHSDLRYMHNITVTYKF